MKKILLVICVAAFGCDTKDISEVGCNCNEVKDKEIVAHEYPYLYWDYNLYVDYCGSTKWVSVQQSEYNQTNRGDCL